MATVWFVAASALMVVLALVLVVLPLLRKRDPSADPRKLLQRAHTAGLLSDAEYSAKVAALPAASTHNGNARNWALGLAFVIPLGVATIYSFIGTPDGLTVPETTAASPHNGAGAAGNAAMVDATRGLAERLAQQPDDHDGWLLLARAYKVMEQYDNALAALDSMAERWPDDSDMLIERAGLLVLRDPEQRITPEVEMMVDRVLATVPDDSQANWLKGMAAYQTGAFADAAARWQPLLDAMPAEAEGRDMLVSQINDARSRAGLPLLTQVAPTAAAAMPASAAPMMSAAAPTNAGEGPRLRVRVEIAPALKARLQPNDVLFVSARASEGPRIPLAALRLNPAELPLELELSDADAMAPQFRLSTAAQVVVSARISHAGIADAAPGDFEATPHTTATSVTEPFTLRIDHVRE